MVFSLRFLVTLGWIKKLECVRQKALGLLIGFCCRGGTNVFPTCLRGTGSAEDPPRFIFISISGLSTGPSVPCPRGGDCISRSSPDVPTPGWVPPQFYFTASSPPYLLFAPFGCSCPERGLSAPWVTQPPSLEMLGVPGGAGPRCSAAGLPSSAPGSGSSTGRALAGPAERVPSSAITAPKCTFL